MVDLERVSCLSLVLVTKGRQVSFVFPFSIALLCMCTFVSNVLFFLFFFFFSLYIIHKFELGVLIKSFW